MMMIMIIRRIALLLLVLLLMLVLFLVVGPWNMYNSGSLRVHSVGGSRRQWRVGWVRLGWWDGAVVVGPDKA